MYIWEGGLVCFIEVCMDDSLDLSIILELFYKSSFLPRCTYAFRRGLLLYVAFMVHFDDLPFALFALSDSKAASLLDGGNVSVFPSLG